MEASASENLSPTESENANLRMGNVAVTMTNTAGSHSSAAVAPGRV